MKVMWNFPFSRERYNRFNERLCEGDAQNNTLMEPRMITRRKITENWYNFARGRSRENFP